MSGYNIDTFVRQTHHQEVEVVLRQWTPSPTIKQCLYPTAWQCFLTRVPAIKGSSLLRSPTTEMQLILYFSDNEGKKINYNNNERTADIDR